MKYWLLLALLLLASPVEAVTRYATHTGGTTNCTTMLSASTPGTVPAALGCMSGGDRLELSGGTYAPASQYPNPPSGTAGAHTVIAAKAGETVTFKLVSGTSTVIWNFYAGGFQYVDFVGGCTGITNRTCRMNWDGTGLDSFGQSGIQFSKSGMATNITFDGVRVHNWANNNFTVSASTGTNVTFKNGRVDIAPAGVYNFYVASNVGLIVENSEIDNAGGYGIHTHGESGTGSPNIYRFNYFHDNGFTPTPTFSTINAILIGASCNNCEAYGNIIWNHNLGKANPGAGIRAAYGANGTKIYNNTIYMDNNGTDSQCISVGDFGASNTVVRNNICHNTSDPIGDTGTSTTFSNNLAGVSDTGITYTETASTTFISPSSDFHLKAGSNAIGNGTTTGNPAGNTVDIAGLPRVAPYDIGAYAAEVTPTCPPVTPALVASYSFDNDAGDGTGKGHTATPGSGWSYVAGKYNQGISSTGASGITVADANDLDFCGGFTYEGWISLASTSGDSAFIVKNPDSSSVVFAALTSGCGAGAPNAGFSAGGVGVNTCYGSALTTGTFHHLAATYDATLPSDNLKLYIDGKQVASANGNAAIDATTGTLQFCTSGFGETCPSGTIIDEVRIYNYPRSAAEIFSDMSTPLNPVGPSPVTELRVSGGSRRIGPGVTLRYGLK